MLGEVRGCGIFGEGEQGGSSPSAVLSSKLSGGGWTWDSKSRVGPGRFSELSRNSSRTSKSSGS